MPYIAQEDRPKFDEHLFDLGEQISSPGEFNYVITKLAHITLLNSDGRYDSYNAILGAFEAAKLEFYRDQVAPYEDLKKQENGDVLTEDEVERVD